MASRLLSEEQSALALELLCELAASERGDAAAATPEEGCEDGESVRRRRVREALQHERTLEAQKALLRAAIKDDRKEAVSAPAAPATLLPNVRLTLRNAAATKVVVVKRKDGVAELHKLAVSKLKVHKAAVHALCQPGGMQLRDLTTVPDGATVEFTNVAPSEAAAAEDSSASPDTGDDTAFNEAGLDAALAARRSAASALSAARLSPRDAAAESERLLAAVRSGASYPSAMAAARAALPCVPLKQQILDALASQDVLLLAGATGSGKSTQVPQYVLEDAIERGVGAETYIVVAQPRRVAATSLARRVAAERGERPGDVVGFAVRGASQSSRRTRILYCTVGIMLRQLTDNPYLPGVTHVFIDEVHERSLEVDMCLLLLRRTLAAAAADAAAPRPPHVCLMSATADAAPLAAYFGPRVGVLRVPGRAHPVQTLFLEDILEANPGFHFAPPPGPSPQAAVRHAAEGPPPQVRTLELPGDAGFQSVLPSLRDAPLPQRGYSAATLSVMRGWDGERVDYTLLALAVTHAVTRCCDGSPPGAVLVFLQGAPEIARAAKALEAHAPLRAARVCCVPLHGSLPPAAQQRAFEPAPQSCVKVVLATNVAETALTIPDVTCVVDTARVKEMSFDAARGVGRLQEGLACRAALAQRSGRAGRVRPGVALRLLPRAAFDALPHAAPPEMLRSPLENALLAAHALLGSTASAADAMSLLRAAPTPPPPAALAAAAATLRTVGAVADDPAAERLTPLGLLLSLIPADVRLAKMCVVAAMLGCLPPALTAAAVLATRSPFFSGSGGPGGTAAADAARRRFAAGSASDHLAAVAAFDGWRAALQAGGRGAERAYADANCLSLATLREINDARAVLRSRLVDAGLAPPQEDDAVADANTDGNDPLLRAVLAAGLWPHVARASRAPARRPGDAPSTLLLGRSTELRPHSGSVNASGLPDGAWVAFHDATSGASGAGTALVRDSTRVPALALALFAGSALRVDHGGGAVTLDGWVRLRASPQEGALLKMLRKRLDAALLARATARPGAAEDTRHAATLAAVARLLRAERAPVLRAAK